MGGGIPNRIRGYRVTRFSTLVIISRYIILPPHPSVPPLYPLYQLTLLPLPAPHTGLYPTATTTDSRPAPLNITLPPHTYIESSKLHIYCANLFCLQVMYVSTSSNPEYLITSTRGGGISHLRETSEAAYLSAGGPPCGGISPYSCQHGGSPPTSPSLIGGITGRTP